MEETTRHEQPPTPWFAYAFGLLACSSTIRRAGVASKRPTNAIGWGMPPIAASETEMVTSASSTALATDQTSAPGASTTLAGSVRR
jgi:hypothetical protein